jgi:hypothetical protein
MLTPYEILRLRSELAHEELTEVQRHTAALRSQLDALKAQRNRLQTAYDLALAEEQRLLLQWLKASRQYAYYPPIHQDERPFVLLVPMCIH